MSQSTEVAFCEFLAVYGKKYNEQKKNSEKENNRRSGSFRDDVTRHVYI